MERNLAFYPSLLPKKTAVTLVAHGLNLRPEAMLPFIECLRRSGSAVYLVKLSGHFECNEAFPQITTASWQSEMQQGYKKAKNAAMIAAVPLFFLGYSLGALLGQSMIALNQKTAAFDRQVLLAPATAIRRRSYLLKAFFIFGLSRRVPSFTPKQYRANHSLPLLFYRILFGEEKKVLHGEQKELNIPTLVIIDPKDELVSYKKLKALVSKFKLTNYKMVFVTTDAQNRKNRYHHLILDEQTLGKEAWKLVTSEITAFLFGSAQEEL